MTTSKRRDKKGNRCKGTRPSHVTTTEFTCWMSIRAAHALFRRFFLPSSCTVTGDVFHNQPKTRRVANVYKSPALICIPCRTRDRVKTDVTQAQQIKAGTEGAKLRNGDSEMDKEYIADGGRFHDGCVADMTLVITFARWRRFFRWTSKLSKDSSGPGLYT